MDLKTLLLDNSGEQSKQRLRAVSDRYSAKEVATLAAQCPFSIIDLVEIIKVTPQEKRALLLGKSDEFTKMISHHTNVCTVWALTLLAKAEAWADAP